MKKLLLAVLSLYLLCAGEAAADDPSWLQIGGDYRFRYDYLKGSIHAYRQADLTLANPPGSAMPGFTVENSSLMLNRFGLNLKADALEDVTVKARFLMYKVWGHETATPVEGGTAVPVGFFGDRAMGVNDGTIGHVPSDNALRVDYVYATVGNLFDAPAWFSVGRRPSTGGIPSNLRQNQERTGTAGMPSLMIDYAFDGMTLGFAPDMNALPGAYAKLCYGKGFDSGYQPTTGASLKDTDFLGLNLAVLDSDLVHVELQYQKGWHISDTPSDGAFGTSGPTENLGNIRWLGGVATGKIGPLNLFLSAAQSKTDPDNNTFGSNASPWGHLWTAVGAGGEGPVSAEGFALYTGARYDMNRTKIGVEYNRGSKNWIGMVPSEDDIWTSKLGTRGSVYEVYMIQELDRKPISRNAKAFLRLGYQYYRFAYTGSNFWIGAPVSISDLTSASTINQQIMAPVDTAKDLYLTFDVQF